MLIQVFSHIRPSPTEKSVVRKNKDFRSGKYSDREDRSSRWKAMDEERGREKLGENKEACDLDLLTSRTTKPRTKLENVPR